MAVQAQYPEQGQMVSVRSRNWMVTDVSASTLPPERLLTGLESPQHLLTLASVEDDGLGTRRRSPGGGRGTRRPAARPVRPAPAASGRPPRRPAGDSRCGVRRSGPWPGVECPPP